MWVRHYERPLYSHFNNCYYKICISAALKKCSFNNSGPLLTYESPFGNNWSRTVLKPCCLNMFLAPTCLKTSFFFAFFLPLFYSLFNKVYLTTCHSSPALPIYFTMSAGSQFSWSLSSTILYKWLKRGGKKRGSAWCAAGADKHDQLVKGHWVYLKADRGLCSVPLH